MKALGYMVSGNKIFYVFPGARMDPRGMVGRIYSRIYKEYPRGTLGRIYIEDHYTLLHTKYESSGPCGFGEEFLCFIHDPWDGARMDPRGTVGRIYKEDYYTLLHTKYESSGPCGFRDEDFFFMFSHCKSKGANDPRGGAIFDPRGMIGRIYNEDHYTLLHTKYESFGSCGFGEEDFFYVFPMRPPGRGLYGPQGHSWQDL